METINNLVNQVTHGQNSMPTQRKQWPHLQAASASLRSCHSNLNAFCVMYNPDLQQVAADNEQRAILGTAPMLCVLDAAYGDGSAVTWLIPQLHNLCAAVGVKTKLDDNQLMQLATMIRTEFGYLKATEVMLFLYRLKGGHYGEFFGSVDIQRVMRALRGKFSDERVKVIERHEEERQDRERIERAKTALKPHEIEQLRLRLEQEGKI